MPGKVRCSTIAFALAAFSPVAANAQSSVALYGLLDVAVGSFKASGAPAATIGEVSGAQSASFWGMRGTEDLGSGFKAGFAIEGYFLVNNGQAGRFAGDTTFSRNAYVDLASPYGTLRLGRVVTPFYYITARTNPMGASFRFSPFMTQTWVSDFGRTVLGDTSWDSSILYESPSIYGIKFTLDETAPGTGAHNQSATVEYNQGPFYLAGVVQRVKTGLAITPHIYRVDTYFFGGTYNLEYAKLYASYTHDAYSINGAIDNTYHGGVSIPIEFLVLEVDYSRTNTLVGGGAANHFRNTAGVTFDYLLSKATDLYASYMYDKLSTAGTANSFGVGIRHTF